MDAKTLGDISVDPELTRLLEKARKRSPMSPAEIRQQAISFAYGNASLHNPAITKEMVERAYDDMHPK